MQYGDDRLSAPKSPERPDLPRRRRRWRIQLAGAAVGILGIVCGGLGAKWGGTANTILVIVWAGVVVIGAGVFLISWGGGRGIPRAVCSALVPMLFLGGVAGAFFAIAHRYSDERNISLIACGAVVTGAFVLALALDTAQKRSESPFRYSGQDEEWRGVYYSELKSEAVEQQIEEGGERSRAD